MLFQMQMDSYLIDYAPKFALKMSRLIFQRIIYVGILKDLSQI